MRKDKDRYYLDIAENVSDRSTCLRRRYGAIIVKNDEIIATGYNGAPRETTNCIDCGFCYRKIKNIPAGERYEDCRSVHAEMNAMLSAKRSDMIGATMYLAGIDVSTGQATELPRPCKICSRLIINSMIKEVVVRTPDGGLGFITREILINEMNNELVVTQLKLEEEGEL